MKTENRSFTHRGKTHRGTIVWPEDLAEALKLVGDRETWAAFKIGYLELCRRRICGIIPRRRTQTIDLRELPVEAQELVRDLVQQLHDQNRLHQQAQKSVPPEEPQTSPIDYDGMPTEAEDPFFSNAPEFEQSPPTDSDALDS
jgi:hypothetical protein